MWGGDGRKQGNDGCPGEAKSAFDLVHRYLQVAPQISVLARLTISTVRLTTSAGPHTKTWSVSRVRYTRRPLAPLIRCKFC